MKDIPIRYSLSNDKTIKLDPKKQIVDVISYCLMPNHFHFLLKQIINEGIKSFVSKTTNSYAKYFNIKHKRKGPLFEGVFKAVRIDTNEQLLHVSRYIHLNPLVGYVTDDLNSYKWSSYLEFVKGLEGICSKDVILSQFTSRKKYERFVLDHEQYGKKLERIKHLLFGENDDFPVVYAQNTPGVFYK